MRGLDDFPAALALPIAEEYADGSALAPIEVRLEASRKLMRGYLKVFPDDALLQVCVTSVLQILRDPDLKKSTTTN